VRILLVEDNADLAANISEFLLSRGQAVDHAYDGRTGLRLAAAHPYDALILDLNLPGMDGLALCRRLREGAHRDISILMLTARDTEPDKLEGFEAGADDYLTKPFSLLELLARLKAMKRRQSDSGSTLEVADLSFDPRTLIVRRAGRRVELAPTALRLLEQLMRAAPGVVTRAQIERTIWGGDPPQSDAALRGHVHALRAAIEPAGAPKLLHTVHGIGYRLAAGDEI
jgi:DNA-binding response OmpR family regulator